MIALPASGLAACFALLLSLLATGPGSLPDPPDPSVADDLNSRLLVALMCAAQL